MGTLDALKSLADKPFNQIVEILVSAGEYIFIISALVMMLIQMVKVPLRRFFYRQKLQAWLHGFTYPLLPKTYLVPLLYWKRRKEIKETLATENNEQINPEARKEFIIKSNEIFQELVNLSTAGNTYALFQLSIEQLCGQIQAAVQTALGSPDLHADLLQSLMGGKSQDGYSEDLKSLKEHHETIRAESERKNQKFVKKLQHKVKLNDQEYLRARNNLHNSIQRNIDALQISAGIEWKAWLKFLATVMSAIILALLYISHWDAQHSFGNLALILILAPFSGFVSTVLRDMLAVIEKLRS